MRKNCAEIISVPPAWWLAFSMLSLACWYDLDFLLWNAFNLKILNLLHHMLCNLYLNIFCIILGVASESYTIPPYYVQHPTQLYRYQIRFTFGKPCSMSYCEVHVIYNFSTISIPTAVKRCNWCNRNQAISNSMHSMAVQLFMLGARRVYNLTVRDKNTYVIAWTSIRGSIGGPFY